MNLASVPVQDRGEYAMSILQQDVLELDAAWRGDGIFYLPWMVVMV
jgi:hypothetical protein